MGNLGLGDRVSHSSPTQIPGTTWAKFDTALRTTAAIKTDGTLWMWGGNHEGELGQNQQMSPSNAGYSSPVQIPGTTWDRPISGGGEVSVVLKTDGTLWGMGKNERGELGINNTTSISSPVQVGSDTTWKDGVGNNGRTFATKTDGTLWGWGENYQGGLGINESSLTRYSSPVQIPGTWISVHGWNSGGGGIK